MLKAIFSKKINMVFLVLGLIVLGELVWGIFYLTRPLGERETVPTPEAVILPTPAPKPSLVLDPREGSFRVGEIFGVNIILDTKGRKVAGCDAVLYFDPQILSVVDSIATISGVQINPANIFSSYPSNLVDTGTGRIALSGLSEINKPYSGKGVLAMVTFKAQASGSALLKFDFQPGQTSDSNLADYETSEDILGEVVDAQYVVVEE